MTDRFVIGLTGNIACGKSAIAQRLGETGVTVLDADRIYHELIAPGSPLLNALAERFGNQILLESGGLNRPALAAIVFSDPAALADLDRLTHPAIIAETLRRLEQTTGIVVIDAVKLIESGLGAVCDEIWLVTCPAHLQRERLMKRNGISDHDARLRIAAQSPVESRLILATRMLDNSGTLDDLHVAVDRALQDVIAEQR